MPKHLHFLRFALLAASLALMGVQPAAAEVSQKVAARLKTAITANTKGMVRVDQINATPIPGIYEVISENEIFYTEETGRYSFVGGSLIDTESRKDLTSLQQDNKLAVSGQDGFASAAPELGIVTVTARPGSQPSLPLGAITSPAASAKPSTPSQAADGQTTP